MIAAAKPTAIAADAERAADAAAVAERIGIPFVELAGFGDDEDDADVFEPRLRETDAHVVFFTSGSTGRPKGAVISNRVNVLRTHPGALLEPKGTMVAPFPLFHMGAWTMAIQQWQAREAMVFATTDPVAICDAIERHQAKRVHCLPGIWRRVLEHLDTPEGRARDLSCVRVRRRRDLGHSDRAAHRHRPRHCRTQRCGSSTARPKPGSVSWLPPDDMYRKPGSVGVPAILTETRVDPGGELCVRGPLLFDGYLDDPEATAAALEDGWYHTGDVVDVDDEGYFSIVGRARDVIRTGGETVAPPEVEAVLGQYPGVADVAVIGLPDQQWGEVVCAVIVAEAGQPVPSLDDLRAFCESRLARFKQPRRVDGDRRRSRARPPPSRSSAAS